MSIAIRQKDPADKSTFPLDYSDWLEGLGVGLTITNSVWTVPAGLTETGSAIIGGGTITTITVSGGTDGRDYELLNHVTVSDLQEKDASFLLQVRHVEAGSSQDATDRSNALNLLLRWLQKDVVPPLHLTDIEAILDAHKAASTWSPNTFYAVGQKLLPAVRNGWWYEVVQPGTSQSGTRAFADWPTRFGQRLIDGTSDPQLILEVAGEDSIFRAVHSDPLSVNVYDVRGAARECIQLRLQLGSQMVDEIGVSFDQITQHLEGLLKRFYPIRFPISVVRA